VKLGFIILCRYNSSRLPGKILREINGKPILKYIFESLSQVVSPENIIVATSEEETDNPIVEYCKKNKINVFRGSLENVAERFLECAKHFNLDYATRINGDNLFIDLNTIKSMLEIARKNTFDLVSNVKNRTFPKGMSVEMVKVNYYNEIYKKFNKPEHFEHVTIYLYQNDAEQNFYYFFNQTCIEAAGIQMAIDDQHDFETASKIIAKFDREHFTYSLKEVFEIYKNVNEQSI